MTLAPTAAERRARAHGDLRIGLPVVLGPDTGSGHVVLAAEAAGAARLAALTALGPVEMAITRHRAETLKARAYDGDLARLRLPARADAGWVRAVADPARDLSRPMKGPFESLRGGDAGAHRLALVLVKAARLLPAALLAPVAEAGDLARREGLVRLDPAEAAVDRALPALTAVARARVPLALARETRLHVFRPDDGGEEHYALEFGTPQRAAPVLARMHSACFTGDLLGSLKCDCGTQLRAAMAAMAAEGAGVLLYLSQEGRGIGLANKMRAYALQDQGFDTVEANHRLGFEDDERDFRLGAAILREMGFSRARLMTNNPAKVARLAESGIEVVERVPLTVGRTAENTAYLETKARKSGHLF